MTTADKGLQLPRFAVLGALMLVMALVDCAGHGRPRDEARVNVYPENYKSDLLGFLHSYVNDPTEIRDAAISDPALRPVSAAPSGGGAPMPINGGMGGGGGGARGGGGVPSATSTSPAEEGGGGLFGEDKPPERYTVCVRYNAKDLDARYTGVKQGMAVYVRGRFDRFIPQPHGPCDQAEYQPFPELEALHR